MNFLAKVACVALAALMLTPAVVAAPANDDLADATALTFDDFGIATASVDTTGATVEAGEPLPCGNMGATVWFTATAPDAGAISVGTETSLPDTAIAVYKGSTMGDLVLQECNDDTVGFQSRATADVDAGDTVLIQVGGYGGETGSIDVNAQWVPIGGVPGLGGAANYIQPGDELSAQGYGCTSNFVFDGDDGTVYIGTAAHCFEAGWSVSTPGFSNFGVVAFEGNAGNHRTDFQLIAIHPQHHDDVRAWVKGYPQYPTGVTTASETAVGDLIQVSGYGMGFGMTRATQEERQGILYSDNARDFRMNGPLVQGDSGGPLVHVETGKAWGIVSQFGFVGIPPTTDQGPTVEGALDFAADNGFDVTLRTV